MPDFTKYDLTPANNSNAPPDGAPEGMAAAAVNNTMRDTMAVIRDLGDRARGPIHLLGSVSGTNTITAQAGPTISAYADGMLFVLRAAGANTGAVTLNIDGVGAKPVYKATGTTELASGDIPADSTVILIYETASSGRFRILSRNVDAAAGVPIGTVVDFAGTTAPAGWLFCYGQAVSRTTYAALFAVIGTTYGAGNGSSTFNLPDCRGRVVAGKDNMGGASANRLTGQSGGLNGDNLGATGGAETHTLTTDEMPAHTHTVYADTGNSDDGGGGERLRAASSSANKTTSSTGGGGPHNNVQPTLILNKIIFAGA